MRNLRRGCKRTYALQWWRLSALLLLPGCTVGPEVQAACYGRSARVSRR